MLDNCLFHNVDCYDIHYHCCNPPHFHYKDYQLCKIAHLQFLVCSNNRQQNQIQENQHNIHNWCFGGASLRLSGKDSGYPRTCQDLLIAPRGEELVYSVCTSTILINICICMCICFQNLYMCVYLYFRSKLWAEGWRGRPLIPHLLFLASFGKSALPTFYVY